MDSVFFVFLLPVLLVIMMMGLGLELRIQDFIHVTQYPKVVFITLFAQLVLLPTAAFLICIVLDLPPLLAVGFMLLAASPGGPTANLFSYLCQGDVALNISLTAINTILSLFTLPFIMKLSLLYFINSNEYITIPSIKMIQVFLIILIPVCVGMLLRAKFPRLSITVSQSMRVFSIAFLVMLFIFAVVRERFHLVEYFMSIGVAIMVFCFTSLFIGYCLPLLVGVAEKQARACTFEIGIHNTAIAMTIAISVLGNTMIAVPAGIYTIVMYSFAMLFALLMFRQRPTFNEPKSHISEL